MIKKFKRRKVYARFKDNIWEADLYEMGFIVSSVLNNGKSDIPSLFNGTKLFSSASDKAKLLGENISEL